MQTPLSFPWDDEKYPSAGIKPHGLVARGGSHSQEMPCLKNGVNLLFVWAALDAV